MAEYRIVFRDCDSGQEDYSEIFTAESEEEAIGRFMSDKESVKMDEDSNVLICNNLTDKKD